MTTSESAWAPADLRRALLLAYPTLREAASEVGVSTRTVQRWLTLASTPTPEHAQRLREVLLPASDVLRRQREEVELAEHAVTLLRNTRSSVIPQAWRVRRWHQPHTLAIWQNEQLGVSRPVIHNTSAGRRYERGWTPVTDLACSNQPAAVLARADLLEQVASRRVTVRRELCPTGGSLCYLTPEAEPTLRDVAD